MKLWTIQMSQWRLAKARGIEILDTTVKSGEARFAPTWDIVMAVKARTKENEEEAKEIYTNAYSALMRDSYRNNREYWLEVLRKDELAVACYCAAGEFCHRHLLATYLGRTAERNGIEFTLMGELKK